MTARCTSSAGYDSAGCSSVTLDAANKATPAYSNKVMKNHHGGVILVGDYLYGHGDPGWVCQNFKTGEEVWSHRGFGKGAVHYADGMLYCLAEDWGSCARRGQPQGLDRTRPVQDRTPDQAAQSPGPSDPSGGRERTPLPPRSECCSATT